MNHIGFYNPKGGVGKTALAINVASMIASMNFRVALVDLDPQRSAKWISGIADGFPFPVYAGWPDKQPNVDFLITDHPPRLENIPPSGVIAAPVRPVAHEVAALMAAIKQIKDSDAHVIMPVINFYDSRRADHRENVEAVADLAGAVRIGNRAVFERAINRGVTIHNPVLDKMSGIQQARWEIECLAVRLMAYFEILDGLK